MGSSIAVVGPGAIGSTVAAYLHASGQPVLLCGHTPREHLDVRADDAAPIIVPGPVHTDPADIAAPVDAVMLAVKATQIDDAGRWLMALCDEHTVVCVLQNGVEQVELVSPHCPASRVYPRSSGSPPKRNLEAGCGCAGSRGSRCPLPAAWWPIC